MTPASYDLHLHTFWSYDATAEPEAYFKRATELGVRCLAITEHHNIDSAPEVAAVAARYPHVRLLRAAELTVTTRFGSVDLLCYNLPETPEGPLAEVLCDYRAWQQQAGAATARGFAAQGLPYDAAAHREAVLRVRPERVVEQQGATHLPVGVQAAYFREKGWIDSEESFRQLKARFTSEHRVPPYPQAAKVVPAVKAAGGLIVIAHPTHYFLRNDLTRMDALREECALDGIECAHRIVPPELTPFYRSYCLRNGLLSTAGSDSHHLADLANPEGQWGHTPERRFARHLGEPEWLEELLERIAP